MTAKPGRRPGRTMETVRKDAEAARLRAQGLTYAQIAEQMGCASSNAYQSVQRALAAVPVEAVTELRQIECDRLDAIIARLWDIVNARHPVFQQSKVVPRLTDSGPVIAALREIRQAAESKRKLLGLDAPIKQTITVISEDVVDAEIRRLEEELAARDADHVDAQV